MIIEFIEFLINFIKYMHIVNVIGYTIVFILNLNFSASCGFVGNYYVIIKICIFVRVVNNNYPCFGLLFVIKRKINIRIIIRF